ncbi:50S ribosomal protein L9 [Myxococcota bacterium]|nr:50S ribosomal protein L9 [Myxococcota bacterium]
MKVILSQDLETLGRAGDVKEVSDGYARNFLFPRGIALPATRRSMEQIEHQKRLVADRIAAARKAAMGLKERIEATPCKVAREAGEEDRIFGSVTARDIAAALAEEGIEVDHRKIQLEQPLKNLGVFTVPVRLEREVVAEAKVWVVAK